MNSDGSYDDLFVARSGDTPPMGMEPAWEPAEERAPTPQPKRKKRRGCGIIVVIAAVVAVIIAIAGYLFVWPELGHGNNNGTKVGPKGGELTVKGLTVIVPPGAVDREVELTVSPPKRPAALGSPLKEMGGSALEFDISLDGGRVTKPAKPLGLRVTPNALFPGATGNPVWLYSPQIGQGAKWEYEYIPTTSLAGRLDASLPHLSSFTLISPDFNTWVGSVIDASGKMLSQASAWVEDNTIPEGIRKSRPSDCKQELKVGEATVSFPAGSQQGWAYNRESPVHPCLERRGDGLSIKVANNTLAYWGARTSSGVKLTSSHDGTDAELTKLVLKKVLGEKGIKEYLARQGSLEARTSSLSDVRILLTTDFGAFHAEELVVVLGLVTEFFGVKIDGVEQLLKIGSVTDCLKGAVKVNKGGNVVDQMTRLFDIVTSECGVVIAEGLGYQTADSSWADAVKRNLAIASAIGKAAGGLLGGLDGIIRKLGAKPVQIYVSVTRPVKCLSAAEFESGGYYQKPEGATGFRVKQITCGNGYAAVSFGDSIMPSNVYLLKLGPGGWTPLWNNEGAEEAPCDLLPSVVRQLVC